MSKNKVQAKIKIDGFGEVVKQLAKMSGKDFKTVLDAEVGAVLKGAIRRTKIAKPKSIVERNMPKGKRLKGSDGQKLIRRGEDGKVYHVGEPELIGRMPNNADINKGKKEGKLAKGKWPKRGGAIYRHPYHKYYKKTRGQKWINNSKDGKGKFQALMSEYEKRTQSKLKYRGISAGQFYFMAKTIGIPMTGRIKSEKLISRNEIGQKLKPFLQSKRFNRPRFMYSIRVGSSGVRQSARTNAQRVLMLSTRARITNFKRAVKKEWTKDLKTYMPKNYPLLFK